MPTWTRHLYEHDRLAIAKGEVNGHSGVHKFGAVPAMSQNQSGTIWDINDTNYPWSSLTSASILTVPAVNASDNGKEIIVIGLGADYAEQSEVISVSSAGPVTTTKSFLRVYRAYMYNGSSTNIADINIQVSGTTVARISAGKGQTLMAVYTVPAGYTAYITKGVCSCQAGADATGDMYVRYGGQSAFRIGHSFEVSGSGGQYIYDFDVPVAIPEKSDIDVRARVRSNNARITAAFDLILMRNEYGHQ